MKDGLFKNKYRRDSLRLEGFDYGTNGAYFITICSHKRIQAFSKIVSGEVHLTPLGSIIQEEWEKTSKIREYVTTTDFVVMPDHIHGIVFIHKNSNVPCELPLYGNHLHFPEGYHNRFGPQSKNLASIVRGFKSAVTQRAKIAGLDTPVWQSKYYEHIIRNARAYERISLYIANNPIRWSQEKDLPNSGERIAA